MATYVFPPRSERFATYVLRLFAIYGVFLAAVGVLASFIILGIVHSASTILALICLALCLVIGRELKVSLEFVARARRRVTGKSNAVEDLDREYKDLALMYAAREAELILLAEENRQLREELKNSQVSKRTA
jgi:signal transduction histidine kinase